MAQSAYGPYEDNHAQCDTIKQGQFNRPSSCRYYDHQARQSNRPSSCRYYYLHGLHHSLPILGNDDAPLKVQVHDLVIIDETTSSFVLSACQHA